MTFDRQTSQENLAAPLFQHSPCPLCGGKRTTQRYPINKDFPSRLSGFDLSQINIGIDSCSACGHQFIQPVPTTKFLEAYYASYMTEAKENFYRDREVSKIPSIFRDSYGKRLSQIQRVLGASGHLLDVGSGLGMFLRLAKERGFEVSGVEPSAYAVKKLRDSHEIDAAQCFFEDFETVVRFDVITMWDFLEHLGEPVVALRKAFSLLRPGGLLVVETPARDSIVHWVAKFAYHATLGKVTQALNLTYGLHHLQYFSSRSLSAVIASAGFEVIECDRGATSLQDLGLIDTGSLRGFAKSLMIRMVFTLGSVTGKTNKVVVIARRPAACIAEVATRCG